MLEVRYNKKTKEITGWWGNRHGNHDIKLKNRPDETIILLDIPIPSLSLAAYLMKVDLKGLKSNPNYVEPVRQNLADEINNLEARIQALETTTVQ